MNKPSCIYVDEPESYVLLTKGYRTHYDYVLPLFLDNLVFCILNDLFLTGVNVPIDIKRVTRILCTNIISCNPSQVLTISDILVRLIGPLEEIANLLIPALTRLDKFSQVVDTHIYNNQVKLTIKTLH